MQYDCESCKAAEKCILRRSGGTVKRCDFIHIGLKKGSNTYADLLGGNDEEVHAS